jgi:hypothetical protein
MDKPELIAYSYGLPGMDCPYPTVCKPRQTSDHQSDSQGSSMLYNSAALDPDTRLQTSGTTTTNRAKTRMSAKKASLIKRFCRRSDMWCVCT